VNIALQAIGIISHQGKIASREDIYEGIFKS